MGAEEDQWIQKEEASRVEGGGWAKASAEVVDDERKKGRGFLLSLRKEKKSTRLGRKKR
jgi:hypothetical protein